MQATDATQLTVESSASTSDLGRRVEEIFVRRVGELGGLAAPLELSLSLARDFAADEFEVRDSPGGIAIRSGAERGLLYGVGKLLRDMEAGAEGIRPGNWRGRSAPAKPVRGMYFATHFHNFYHVAPLPEIERYIEDMALWGCNLLHVWFDLHHFRGISDPAAQEMLERLRAILRCARSLGLGCGIGVLANEAYANSPTELRSDGNTGRCHYGVELCPHKPGAPELMLSWIDEELAAFEDIGLDSLWIWPYDQGGCACEQCRPWGANGCFPLMARHIAALFRRRFPAGKVVLSTWLFDYGEPQGEWEGLGRALDEDADWLDVILADTHDREFPAFPLEHGVPGGLPMVTFPEISMLGMLPWGGFGANPRPWALGELMDRVEPSIAGGIPYSEGIFEDLNKFVMLRLFWDPSQPADEIVREYLASEFSADSADDALEGIRILERNLDHNVMLTLGDRNSWPYQWPVAAADGEAPTFQFQTGPLREARQALELMQRAEASMPPSARRSWRWRILMIRAALDAALSGTMGTPDPALDPLFEELAELYHADRVIACLVPPSSAALAKHVRQS